MHNVFLIIWYIERAKKNHLFNKVHSWVKEYKEKEIIIMIPIYEDTRNLLRHDSKKKQENVFWVWL